MGKKGKNMGEIQNTKAYKLGRSEAIDIDMKKPKQKAICLCGPTKSDIGMGNWDANVFPIRRWAAGVVPVSMTFRLWKMKYGKQRRSNTPNGGKENMKKILCWLGIHNIDKQRIRMRTIKGTKIRYGKWKVHCVWCRRWL